MNSASLETSPRLQRTLAALRAAGGWLTTREIIAEADVCAVNSCIAELRDNGVLIESKQETWSGGRRVWSYRLRLPAQGELAL
ncbi:MAG: hypothetical protein F4Y03_00510 [Alphaproteobacteria bacterium]|nr:hypothetical protein [Alphaproteobacteria bacterium]